MTLPTLRENLDLADAKWWHELSCSAKLAHLSLAFEHLELMNKFLNQLTDDVFEDLFNEIVPRRKSNSVWNPPA